MEGLEVGNKDLVLVILQGGGSEEDLRHLLGGMLIVERKESKLLSSILNHPDEVEIPDRILVDSRIEGAQSLVEDLRRKVGSAEITLYESAKVPDLTSVCLP